MFKLHRVLMTAAVLALTTTTASASLVGTIPGIGSAGELTTAGDVITIPYLTATADGTGDFSYISPAVPIPDVFGQDLTLDLGNAASGFGFDFSGALGSFVASSGAIAPGSPGFVNLFVYGTFTTPDAVSGPASIRLTLAFNGQTYSSLAGTLVAPIIPEPSSLALAGLGLASAGAFGLRKRYAK